MSDHDIVVAKVSVKPKLTKQGSVRVPERLALPTSVHGVPGSNPAGGEILPEPKGRFIAQNLSCSSFHRLEVTEILLKGRKTLTHPSITKQVHGDIPLYKKADWDQLSSLWETDYLWLIVKSAASSEKGINTTNVGPVLVDQTKFLQLKHLVRQLLEKSHEKYLQNTLGLSNEAGDHAGEVPPEVKTKNLYSLLQAGFQWYSFAEGWWKYFLFRTRQG